MMASFSPASSRWTKPTRWTLAGIAVKLRWVRQQECDPEMGAGFALGQCLDALSRVIAGGAVERETAAHAGKSDG